MTGNILAVSVGRPRAVQYRGREVTTGIFKEPVAGRRRITQLRVEGDVQCDPRYHGGFDKAVYVLPSEHYAYWTGVLKRELPWGSFGENLTTRGILEDDVRVGDVFRAGTAELVVTSPRTPCYKLNVRFNRPDMTRRLWDFGRSGFYCSVRAEGDVGAGDRVHLVTGGTGPSVLEVFAAIAGGR